MLHDDCTLNQLVILSSFHNAHDYHFPKNDLYHFLMVMSCIPSCFVYKHQPSASKSVIENLLKCSKKHEQTCKMNFE